MKLLRSHGSTSELLLLGEKDERCLFGEGVWRVIWVNELGQNPYVFIQLVRAGEHGQLLYSLLARTHTRRGRSKGYYQCTRCTVVLGQFH